MGPIGTVSGMLNRPTNATSASSIQKIGPPAKRVFPFSLSGAEETETFKFCPAPLKWLCVIPFLSRICLKTPKHALRSQFTAIWCRNLIKSELNVAERRCFGDRRWRCWHDVRDRGRKARSFCIGPGPREKPGDKIRISGADAATLPIFMRARRTSCRKTRISAFRH